MKIPAMALALLLSATAQGAEARDPAQADALFKEGQALMKAGTFDQACEKFSASYALDPAGGTLLNLAACQEKAGHLATSLKLYQESVDLAVAKGNQDREKFARGKVEALAPQVNHVKFAVTRPVLGQELRLDGQVIAWELWGAGTAIDSGKHEVEVTAPDRTRFSTLFVAVPTELEQTVAVPELAAVSSAPVAEATPGAAAPAEKASGPLITVKPLAEPKMSSGRIAGIAVGAVGVGGLAAAVGLMVKASGLASERDDLCPPGASPCYDQAAFDKDHRARLLQQWGFVAGGVGLAAVAVGAMLVAVSKDVVPDDVAPAEKPKPKDPKTDDLSLLLGPTPGGLQLSIGGVF